MHARVDVDALIARGFSIIPLQGKIPPLSWDKYQRRKPTPRELVTWANQYPGANYGIVTGSVSGVIVVDCDTPPALEWLTVRGLPNTLTVQTARGEHFYFRAPAFEVRSSVSQLAPDVDIRGEGGYVVAPGSIHPGDPEKGIAPGHIYTITNDAPIANLPPWLADLLRAANTRATKPATPPAVRRVDEHEQAQRAADAIDVAKLTYGEWVRVGMAMTALGDDGLAIWEGMSARDAARYRPGECARKWSSFTDTDVNIATLFWFADRGNRSWRETGALASVIEAVPSTWRACMNRHLNAAIAPVYELTIAARRAGVIGATFTAGELQQAGTALDMPLTPDTIARGLSEGGAVGIFRNLSDVGVSKVVRYTSHLDSPNVNRVPSTCIHVSKTPAVNDRGRKAKTWELATATAIRDALLNIEYARITERAFGGMVAPVTPATVTAIAPMMSAAQVAADLMVRFGPVIEQQPGYAAILRGARLEYRRAARGLSDLTSTPLTRGFRNSSEYRAAIGRSIIEAEPDRPHSRSELARRIGVSERRVSDPLKRAGIKQQQRTATKTVTSLEDLTAPFSATERGFPLQIDIAGATWRLDQTEKRELGLQAARAAIAKGRPVSVLFQLANAQTLTDAPPVTKTTRKTKPSTQRPRRTDQPHRGAGHDPRWAIRQVTALLLLVTAWRERDGVLQHGETGELADYTAKTVIGLLVAQQEGKREYYETREPNHDHNHHHTTTIEQIESEIAELDNQLEALLAFTEQLQKGESVLVKIGGLIDAARQKTGLLDRAKAERDALEAFRGECAALETLATNVAKADELAQRAARLTAVYKETLVTLRALYTASAEATRKQAARFVGTEHEQAARAALATGQAAAGQRLAHLTTIQLENRIREKHHDN